MKAPSGEPHPETTPTGAPQADSSTALSSNESTVSGPELDEEDQELCLLLGIVLQTAQHFFGGSTTIFEDVTDPRDPGKITYPLESLLFAGTLMFLCRLGARRQIALQFRGKRSREKMEALFRIDTFPHGDTINETLRRLDLNQLQAIVTRMTARLIRSKVLDGYRLHGRHVVAFDGTGTLTFKERHCPHCLTRKQGSGTIYYHNVLEAKLVTPDGFAFSLMTEFIENESSDVSKQDCELRAFYRLVPRLKAQFPRLPLWVTLDGLFACGPVFRLCEDRNWNFTIVLKEGALRSVYQEYQSLKELEPANHLVVHTGTKAEIRQEFRWVNGIPYRDGDGRIHKLSVLECLETAPDPNRPGGTSTKRFVWTTNVNVTERNVREIATSSGRIRWKIENEGFNTQKTGGYELEHAYSEDPKASKAFYFLLQVAHVLSQLLEKGSLLKKTFPKGFGSLKNLARRILEAWRYARHVTRESLDQLFGQRIQIRFNTS